MDNNTPPSDDQNGVQSQNATNFQDNGDSVRTPKQSPVAAGSPKTLIIVAGLVIFSIYILYSMFHQPEQDPNLNPLAIPDKEGKGSTVAAGEKDENTVTATVDLGELPQPPTVSLQPPPPPIGSAYAPPPMLPPPALSVTQNLPPIPQSLEPVSAKTTVRPEIPPPPPPPPVPPTPEISNIGKKTKAISDESVRKRIKSNMLIVDGDKNNKASASSSSGSVSNDPNSTFSESVIRATTAEKAIATGLNNLNMTIAQGKIINAVLETAINTDLPGTLRAIVSRDTYAETGRDVLIPKGSRLIGTYNTGILIGQKRVMIVWTRLIRPDGIDIMIGSPAVDALGRAGINGVVDNKFVDVFSAAILTTAISIGGAAVVEAVIPAQNGSSTTTNTNGNTTTTSSPAQQAAGQSVTDFATTAKNIVTRIADIKPTITIDQGTIVNVFVNRDLTFPSNLSGGVFVQ